MTQRRSPSTVLMYALECSHQCPLQTHLASLRRNTQNYSFFNHARCCSRNRGPRQACQEPGAAHFQVEDAFVKDYGMGLISGGGRMICISKEKMKMGYCVVYICEMIDVYTCEMIEVARLG